jgi:hypothetical protein
MDKNYKLYPFFLTMTGTTVALGGINPTDSYGVCPEVSVKIPSEITQPYLLNITTKSYLEHLPANDDIEDFNKLVTFGKKFLQNEIGIDKNILKIINDNFWDML